MEDDQSMKINPFWESLLLIRNAMSPRGACGMLSINLDPVENVRDGTIVVWSRLVGPTGFTKTAIKNRL